MNNSSDYNTTKTRMAIKRHILDFKAFHKDAKTKEDPEKINIKNDNLKEGTSVTPDGDLQTDFLTVGDLKSMKPGEVFAQGEVENSPSGIYMTDSNKGKMLMWMAKRGDVPDWTIYIHWAENGPEYVESNGDKVTDPKNIRKLVPCDDAALKLYRY